MYKWAFDRGEKRVQCMILSFIPMSKIAAALCAWLLPVTSWEWVGWQRLLSTLSWQAPACLTGQGQILTEVFFQQPFCSGSEHQPARREFSLWSCDGVRVWWGDRCAWISCRTRGTQIFSHPCVFAGDGKAHLSGQISYRSRPSCSWRVSHLREGSTERNRKVKSQHESYHGHKIFPPHTCTVWDITMSSLSSPQHVSQTPSMVTFCFTSVSVSDKTLIYGKPSPVCVLRWALRWELLKYVFLQPGKLHT